MDALSFSERRLSRPELFLGVGGSVVVHVAVLATAIIMPWVMPTKSIQIPFYTVNLVSMQDLGPGALSSNKGMSGKSAQGVKTQETKRSSGAQKGTSGPLVPVRRLQLDEVRKSNEAELKKLDVAEAPKVAESIQPTASIDKSLDQLIRKPKGRDKPAPITQESGKESDKKTGAQDNGRGYAQGSTGKEGSSGKEGSGEKSAAAGAAGSSGNAGKGNGEGGRKGSVQGSEAGSPNGADIGLARKLYYTEVWNAIRRQWALPEFLKSQKLEAVLVIVVRRDGRIVNLQFEKKSGQALFDESVERAVRKADPLPPFPEIYSPPKEEIGLRFRPEDLA